MKLRPREGVAALAALLLGFLVGAGAQEMKKLDLADVVTIVAVDADGSRIAGTDADGRAVSIVVEDATRVLRGTEELSVTDLSRGDRVVVEARREHEGERAGDELVADRLLVVVDPPKAPSREGAGASD